MFQTILTKINNYMKTLLSRIKIRRLLFLMLLLLIGVLVSAFTISTYKTIYNTIYQERIDKIKYVITFVNEVLNY